MSAPARPDIASRTLIERKEYDRAQAIRDHVADTRPDVNEFTSTCVTWKTGGGRRGVFRSAAQPRVGS